MPKILSPINSYKGAVRVVQAGADEVYCGVVIPKLKDFALYRGSSCEIPNYEELGKIVKYVHDHDVKVVVTINRPFMTKTIEKETIKHIRTCYDMGIDGFIVGDMGVLSMVKDIGSDIELYASTYNASMNYEAVDFLAKQGFSRVVLDRQLTLSEISEIVRRSKVGIEVFVHGGGCSNTNANCHLYHYKFPAMVRTAKMSKGLILSPCALDYDVSTLDNRETRLGSIPIMDAFEGCALCKLIELIKMGVCGLKIVGRGDSIWYQESETKVYRELIDHIANDQVEAYYKKLESLKLQTKNCVINQTLPNLRQFYCEQKRCYYEPLFHSPYKYPVSWQAWTKARLMYWKVE